MEGTDIVVASKPELRAEYAFAKYGQYLVLGLVVCGLVLLAIAGVNFAGGPPTVAEQRTVDTTNYSTNVTTRATVTRPSPLFEANRTLRERNVYFVEASPTLQVVVRTTSTASGSVDFAHDARLVIEANRSGQVIWSDQRRLERRTAGSDVVVYELNVSKVRTQTLPPIAQSLPQAATLQSRIVLETNYGSDRYEGSYQKSARLTISQKTYQLSNQLDASKTRRSVQSVRQVDTARTVRLPGIGAVPQNGVRLLIGGLVLLVVAGVGRRVWRRSRHPDIIYQKLRTAEYDQWISPGKSPDPKPGTVIQLTTLKGIVDVGIDAGERVIHDEARGEYVVVTDGVTYVYSTDSLENKTSPTDVETGDDTEPTTNQSSGWRDVLGFEAGDSAGDDDEASADDDAE